MHEVTSFDFLHVVSFCQETGAPDWVILEVNGQTSIGSANDIPVPAMDSTPATRVHETGQAMLVSDWSEERRFPEYARYLTEQRIASTCTVALRRGDRRLGVMTLGRFYPHAYDEEEVRFLHLVGGQIALAIDAAVNFFVSQRVQGQLKLVLELTNQVVSNLEFKELLKAASKSVRQTMLCDAAAILLPAGDGKHLCLHALDFPESRGFFVE